MATPDAVRDEPPEAASAKPRQKTGTYSGRLLLRMPRTLHEQLAKASERDGVSLNQFITGVLASAVDWRNDEAGPGKPRARGRSRGMAFLLAANLVLVGLAAAAAIGFLIAAWLS
ncbi:MAG TPA: toxin-antitoxin system HicB family antitoxin [Gaiellaceae bacterium]|nr:toxin-antitoxin system HicB family antitoxin [Gaiellaceae bacterium]